MKRLIRIGTGRARVLLAVVSSVAAILMAASPANSQVFYSYPGAAVVKDAEPAAGAALGIGDDLLRILGYMRFNVNATTDFGLELVLDHWDGPFGVDDWRIGAGADLKYAIIPKNSTLPFDLAVNAGLGFESGGDVTNINVPLGGMISRPVELSNGRVVVPYGGIYILISHYSYDVDGPGIDNDDTDTDVELRMGARTTISAATSAYATLHLGAGTMFFFGFDVKL